jgi:hypothetical protein
MHPFHGAAGSAKNQMPICLFCLRNFQRLTREHVFPAALGGTLELPNSTCEGCNKGSSSNFEQAIAGRLSHFRRIFGIPDRYGELPMVDITATVAGRAAKGKLHPDGNISLVPSKTIGEAADGKPKVTVYEHLPEEALTKLRKKALRQGWEYEEETLPPREAEVSLSGDLDFLDSPQALRLAAKIAYVALAYRAGISLGRSEAFQRIRDYITTGTGKSPARLFSNERFLDYFSQGPHQHSVVLAGRNEDRKVEAIVRLFGGLCYFVTLSDVYDGADFSFTLALDALRGEEIPALVTNLETEFLQIRDISTAADTAWDDQETAGKSFLGIISRAIDEIQRRNAGRS